MRTVKLLLAKASTSSNRMHWRRGLSGDGTRGANSTIASRSTTAAALQSAATSIVENVLIEVHDHVITANVERELANRDDTLENRG